MTGRIRASIAAAVIILVVVSVFFVIASIISRIVHFPLSLELPLALRIIGAVLIAVGFALILWLLKYRKPSIMLVSTYFTFRKMFTGVPVAEKSGRAEPLIIEGPQKYVRHPLYLGAILAFWGWGFVSGTTSTLVAALLITLWFRLVQIPFEEREMRSLFGDQYVRYMRETPMLIPFTKRK